jgi:hypothetical protein
MLKKQPRRGLNCPVWHSFCDTLFYGGFMAVVPDNYGSFTYNLAQYRGELGAQVASCR